jgi:hypothetical protein
VARFAGGASAAIAGTEIVRISSIAATRIGHLLRRRRSYHFAIRR